MTANHLELLVEEMSMEVFLLPPGRTFEVHSFQGKDDLLGRLESRLLGYSEWLPVDWRIVVVVDRDGDDCQLVNRIAIRARASCRVLTPPVRHPPARGGAYSFSPTTNPK